MRAMMSVLLPAGKGTTKRIGRSGHPSSLVWAMAEAATIADANAINSSRIIRKPRLRALRRSAGPLALQAMLRCLHDRVKGLAMDPSADSGESTSKPTEPTCWSEVTPMQRIVIFLLGLLLGGGLTASVPPGQSHDDPTGRLASPENQPILLHMTTGDSWRGATGLEFARAMLKIGHPVAVFLNLDAVRLALRTGEQEKKASMPQVPREIIADLIRGGAIVLICQPCLSEFGLKHDDIVPGVQLGSPGYLENFVFADNVRTLTW